MELAIQGSSSIRKKELALGDPADAENNVFVSLENTVEQVRRLIAIRNEGTATFIRAPVAAGKSTLANYLARHVPNEFVNISVFSFDEAAQIRDKIIQAADDAETFGEALKELHSKGKTLIFDEAHLLFAFPELVSDIIKVLDSFKPNILLFSAAGTGQDKHGNSVVTPSEVRKKYMWYPPIPDGATLAADLKQAEVYLTSESVDFFLKLCCGHRGIFMSAMQWVQNCQQGSTEEWDIHHSVARVRASFEESIKEDLGGWSKGLRYYLTQSRAVRVNGQFSTLSNIPKEFAEVLFEGSKTLLELNNQERSLAINGFLMPECEKAGEEFVRYDWNDPWKHYGISNSLMAEYYGDILPAQLGYRSQLIEIHQSELCGSDLLARALPFMSFATVIDNPIPDISGRLQTSLSASDLPSEDHYNGALAKVLEKLKYTVSTPQSPNKGKVDVVVTFGKKTCAIEAIMATREKKDHIEHANRFADHFKRNYSEATLKVLLIIGANKDKVRKRLQQTPRIQGLEAVGLVVSQAHDSYEVFVKPDSSQQNVEGPVFFVCDRVAKSLQLRDGRLRISSAQIIHDLKRKHDTNMAEQDHEAESTTRQTNYGRCFFRFVNKRMDTAESIPTDVTVEALNEVEDEDAPVTGKKLLALARQSKTTNAFNRTAQETTNIREGKAKYFFEMVGGPSYAADAFNVLSKERLLNHFDPPRNLIVEFKVSVVAINQHNEEDDDDTMFS